MMNDKLVLYLQNVEKIKLYFGTDADKFSYSLALRYTVKGMVFHYVDYENIAQEIKKQTKWYSFAGVNFNILTSYAAHFGKDYEKVAQALHYQKMLTSYFTGGEHSYIAAMYGSTIEDAQRVNKLTQALANTPNSQFFTLPLQSRALLATRAEEVAILAMSLQQYYEALIQFGFARHSLTYESAFILTVHSGLFDAQLIEQLRAVLAILNQAETTLKKRHYFVVVLLAIAQCGAEDFIKLYELHDALCLQTKLRPKYHPTLLIATQLYTLNKTPFEFSTSDFALTEVIHLFDSASNLDGGTDSGGGE